MNYLWKQSALFQFSYHNFVLRRFFSMISPLHLFPSSDTWLSCTLTLFLLGECVSVRIASTFTSLVTVTAFITFVQRSSHSMLCLGSKQSDFMCACASAFFLLCCLVVCNLLFLLHLMFLRSIFFFSFFSYKGNGIQCCCFFYFLTALSNAIYFTLYPSVFLRDFFFSTLFISLVEFLVFFRFPFLLADRFAIL